MVRSRCLGRLWRIAATALVCGASALAQEVETSHGVSTDAQAERPTITTGALLVQVPVQVTGSSLGQARELRAGEFLLTDNGVKQAVQLERDGDRPLSLVVVMQTGGAARLMFPQFSKLEGALEALLAPHPYRVALVTFDSRVEGATPFTSDLSVWRDALKEPESGDHGAAIFDGIAYAMSLLSKEPAANRHVVLLISQPGDDGSRVKEKELVSTASEAGMTLLSLTFSPELASAKEQLQAPPHLNPPIVVNPSLPPTQAYFDLGEPLRLLLGGLRRNAAAGLADITGGESLRFNNAIQLSADMNTLANDLANRYLLTFTPSNRTPGLHLLEVHLPERPELSVRSRRTYRDDGARRR